MKLSCDVIRDILPLYAENMVSDDTKALVEEHLPGCESCSMALERMRLSIQVPPETDTKGLDKLKKRITKTRILAIWQAILITLSVIGCLLVYFTAPQYLTAQEAIDCVKDIDGNGKQYVYCKEGVSYYIVYDYNEVADKHDTELIYCAGSRLTAWFGTDSGRNVKRFPLSSQTERTVYGTENVLLWGSKTEERISPDMNPVEISLIAVLAAAAILTAIGVLLRKSRGGRCLLYPAMLLWSYLTAHMALCGFDLRTYKLFVGFDLITVSVISGILAAVIFSAAVLSIKKRSTDKAEP